MQVARDFAVMHKLDMDGLKSVLMHLKQRALVEGHMKRVFFQLPVLADKGETKQVLNLTIYEASDPTDLSKKVGTVYGLNAGQVQKLGVTIEKEMVSRMKLRTEVDMKEYVRRQPPSRAAQAAPAQHAPPRVPSPRSPRPAVPQGVGMQTLVVRKDETALRAVGRFAGYMAEVGITLTQQGIDVRTPPPPHPRRSVLCPPLADPLPGCHVPQHRNTAMALQVLAGKIEDMMMIVAINRAAAEAAEKAQG